MKWLRVLTVSFGSSVLLLMSTSVPNEAHPRIDASLAEKIDAFVSDYDHLGVPGASVIIISNGRVLYKKAYGMANVESGIPSTTKTNYRIASMTKQFTAMAVMMLAERHRLSFDDSLTKFFPDFPLYGKRITIRHLLNHTSGLPDYFDLIPPELKAPLTDNDVLDILKRQNHTEFATVAHGLTAALGQSQVRV